MAAMGKGERLTSPDGEPDTGRARATQIGSQRCYTGVARATPGPAMLHGRGPCHPVLRSPPEIDGAGGVAGEWQIDAGSAGG